MDGDGSVLLDKTCGSQIPPPITSKTNSAKVIFRTDRNINDKGFSLDWKVEESGGSGIITSENYPNNYPDKFARNYSINADGTFVIEFSAFVLENPDWSGSCYDWVMIMDGDGSVLLDKTCGSQIPPPITSKTNSAKVIFRTDRNINDKGFSLDWKVEESGGSDCICGETQGQSHPKFPHFRIFGGSTTDKNEYPWMARIISTYSNGRRYGCGGSLISNKWVVTAAHCVQKEKYGIAKEIFLGLGQHDSSSNAKGEKVEKVIVHENYIRKNLQNDIALLKLQQPVDFNKYSHIRPICLPSNSSEKYWGSRAIVAGWGKTGENEGPSNVLLEANVTVLSNIECTKFHRHDSVICAKTTGEGNTVQGHCSGDSGGPLITRREGQTSYTLIGVVSWTIVPFTCMNESNPGGFAEITHFLQWIKDQTEGDNKCNSRFHG